MILNKKHILIYGIAGMIVMASLVFISCEKELSIESTLMSENIEGRVYSSVDNSGIKGAKLTITSLDTKKTYSGTTFNANGNFTIPIDVIPAKKQYKVLVEAAGYQAKDTTVTCGCTDLIISLLKLVPISCDLTISQIEGFPKNLFAGNTYKGTITITNSTALNLPISAYSIIPSDGELVFSNLPNFVPAKETATCSIEFTPKSAKDYNYKIKLFTVCGTSNEILFNAEIAGGSPICSFEKDSDFSEDFVFTIKDSIQIITINNESKNQELHVNFDHLPANPPFTVKPSESFIVPANSYRNVTIKFKYSQQIFIKDSLIISTDGNCGAYLVRFNALYNLPVFQKYVLSKWTNSTTSNPQYVYSGFNFIQSKMKPDTTRLCNSDPSINNITTDDSSDIRFDGTTYDYYSGKQIILLKAFNGLQKLGNLITDHLTFEVSNYQFKINESNFSNKGCDMTFRKWDVVAVNMRNGQKAILLLELTDQDWAGYEFLMISYFYPVD